MVIYLLYNEHLKKWYCEDKSNPKGYVWADVDSAKFWRTESGRTKVYSRKRQLLDDQGFSKLTVQKYELREIRDV